ncbi:MAG: alpha/beta hydrolase [Acidimicrobiia bacterium]|nr:alpha/beta hydrolase [Acidimicrobiia bacterium]
MAAYEELSLLEDNAYEAGIDWHGPPAVERVSVGLPSGRALSGLRWGEGEPDFVLLHGGAQNAHTWDTVALALDRPLLALDLPGHGHSDWRPDHDYRPQAATEEVAVALRALAPAAAMVVGMSLGGLTALCLAASHPELVRRLVVVDVTPGTDGVKAEPIVAFVTGPERFASFEEILDRTVAFNPTRSLASLKRGVLHNAREEPDGGWVWRYDPVRSWSGDSGGPDFAPLWEAVDAVQVPLLLVRGGMSTVVGDDDVAELIRRRPEAEVVVVEGAGHSVQGDRPLELARLLDAFAAK